MTHKEIALRAYYLAQADGFRQSPVHYWYEAEWEIREIERAERLWRVGVVSLGLALFTLGSLLFWHFWLNRP